jgi:predicted RNase H-like HicB family nuclease
MTHTVPVVLRSGEDGWIIAECPIIPGCISQGRTRDEALANIREAIEVCLEAGESLPAEFEVLDLAIPA